MKVESSRMVFWPGPGGLASSAITLFCSLPFLIFGIIGLSVAGPNLLPVSFTVIGIVALAVGISSMFARVVVDDQGITKGPWIVGKFKTRWKDITKWQQIPGTAEDRPKIRFLSRNWKFHQDVWDVDVHKPGFDVFLEHVRLHVGDRETN